MSDIILVEQAASGTPSANQVVMYPKSDGLMYTKDDAGVETALGGLIAATQAQQEAASSIAVAVTPGRQQYHPSAAKAWGKIDYSGGTPSSSASYNISSLTDTGTGDVKVNLTVAFSGSSYSIVTGHQNSTFNVSFGTTVLTQNVGDYQLQHFENGATLTDPAKLLHAAFGDQ